MPAVRRPVRGVAVTLGQRPPITVRREHAAFFVLVILVAAVLIVAPLYRERQRARGMVDNENRALTALLEVAEAEERYREGRGRYGWLGDLVGADLLPGQAIVEEDGRRYLATPGYRVDVLLPHGRKGAEGIAIAPRGPGQPPPHPDLVGRHFAVVARPLEPGATGWRMWYVDEKRDVYLNEGVVETAGALQNRLPQIQVRGSQQLHSGRPLLWQELDELSMD